jgi:hypothetical protein
VVIVDPVKPVTEQDMNVTCTHCKVNDGKTVDNLQMQWVLYSQKCATVHIFLSCNTCREDFTDYTSCGVIWPLQFEIIVVITLLASFSSVI